MSFAPDQQEDETTLPINTSNSKTPFLKSFRSAWKKVKFRRWRRTIDLEQARKNQMEPKIDQMDEAREDAVFYQGASSNPGADQNTTEPGASGGQESASASANCVFISYNSSGDNNDLNGAGALPQRVGGLSSLQQVFLDSIRPESSVLSAFSGQNPTENRRNSNSRANFQVDYINYLIPGLSDIFSCPFYWGKMDRYEAEALLANKPEGSFLLRDSAQDNYVFSVSFRRYSRSLHARIEETKHKFSFDCHDPGVHASKSIRGLLDFYKDPLSCMFFEPMLLFPILRKKPFSLQDLSRTVICDSTSYDGVSELPIPKTLQGFLREYHYKHKVESRPIELASSVIRPPQMPVYDGVVDNVS